VNPVKNTWRVRWDKTPDTESENLASWEEVQFNHKPSAEEIKEAVLAWHNKEIDKKILQNFVWNNLPVWLSPENQFNFKVAYDLTVQLQGANLPLTIKLGELEDGTPAYHTFNALDEFAHFYMTSVQYVQSTLAEGWKIKDFIDWSAYESE
jgi:hypothetical protein